MYLLVIIFATLAASSFVAFFLWYLSWPVVDGKVVDVTTRVTEKTLYVRARKSRIVCYDYRYSDVDYRSVAQGLITRGGLGPKVNVGDTIRVSVCTRWQSLSCPRRVRFEAMVTLSIVLLSTLLVLLAWHRAGAISP